MTRHAGRRPLATLLACLGLLLAMHGAGAGAASAHTELVSTAPTGGGQVTSAPTEVALTFSQPVSLELAQLQVTGPGGHDVQSGEPRVSGDTVAQQLMPLDDAGTYTVAWRVVASDGHPISGTFSFAFSGGATAGGAGATPPETPSDAAAALPDDAAPAAAATDQGASWLPLVAGLIGAAVLLAAATVVLSRRRRTAADAGR